MGPSGQCRAMATSWASAIAAIFTVSVIPPEWHGSGWRMSTTPRARMSRKSQREYFRSPSAMGMGAPRSTSSEGPRFSVSTGSSTNMRS